jgi:L-aminopeptidase/D-esterase-like protein
MRAADLGITIGRLNRGPQNAITDVPGVKVGHETIIRGEGDLVVGEGPVRTGVTVIWPHSDGSIAHDPVYAGWHQLNGNGEMTGLPWIMESGLLGSPVAITNTHSVGVVRDALLAYELARFPSSKEIDWGLPVVAETYDGWLNDINGFHVKQEHVFAAADSASTGPVAEGAVGGGTGMICHEFKAGIGTSSRVLPAKMGGWTVGVLVQANYGERYHLRIDGVPVGRELGYDKVPPPWPKDPVEGSIIIIVATNAPILPDQCRRLAQRATVGLARMGGNGNNSSGDIFLAYSTANRGMSASGTYQPIAVQTLQPDAMTPLFEAVADATEEAILNALCAGTTTVGINGRVAHELPLDDVAQIMKRYGRS